MAKLTESDEAVIRRCAIDRAAFEEERTREEAEALRRQSGGARDGDGLSADDLEVLRRNPVIDRKAFIEERRREPGGTTRQQAAVDYGNEPRKSIVVLTADAGQVDQLIAARTALKLKQAS